MKEPSFDGVKVIHPVSEVACKLFAQMKKNGMLCSVFPCILPKIDKSNFFLDIIDVELSEYHGYDPDIMVQVYL